MSVISARNLTKFYGKTVGVRDIELDVEDGEVFGFIGPNGAGKSTTIRMLMQLVRPTSGEVKLFGSQVSGDMPALRREIGYLPSEINLYKDMTGRQVLDFAAASFGLSLKETPVHEYAELLQYDMNKKVKTYSLGNRKKLGILLSLLHRPRLLILDEPTSGLDPLMQNAFFDLLKDLNEKGMSIFFSTHVLTEVEKLCHRVAIIREGHIIRTAGVEEVAGRNRRIVHVRYEAPGDRRTEWNLQAIDPGVSYTDGVHLFTVQGPIHETLQRIAAHPMADITIEKPTLEQLFMQYYHNEGGARS
jgi:ABC-2 type transport system ATP-binding protein